MCEEHVVLPPFFWTVSGSSPHVRGALARRFASGSATGIIPACAGSTPMSPTGRGAMWDHPRMCGEHLSFMAFLMVSAGSSPHVRGARHHLHKIATRHGIIPACAGSTFNASFGALQNRDHPRMCGEHQCMFPGQVPRRGSSPHVRGALQLRGSRTDARGIIPACAGSTPRRRTGTGKEWDHPRMCGEHYGDSDFVNELEGSSPHVRGARRDMDPVQPAAGIIPACAGSTTGSPGRAHSRRDHPRMCGEHTKELAIGECTVGSSPHVRGARLTLSTQPPATGIIPACAGSTPLLARIRPIQQGSSPHVRGAPVYVSWASSSSGIIPACAGSTSTARKSH